MYQRVETVDACSTQGHLAHQGSSSDRLCGDSYSADVLPQRGSSVLGGFEAVERMFGYETCRGGAPGDRGVIG